MLQSTKPGEPLALTPIISASQARPKTPCFGFLRGFLGTVCRVLCTVGLVVGIPYTAQATTIDFEAPIDPTFAPFAPLFTDGDEFYQSGFRLDSLSNASDAQPGDLVGALVDGTDVANTCFSVLCPTNNPSKFYTGLNDGILVLGSLDDSLFTVNSFDASFVGAGGDPLPSIAGALRLTGFRADNSSISQTYFLTGPNANGELGFHSFLTSGAFSTTPFQYLYVFAFACNASGSCTAFSSDRGQFALDNLDLSVASVAALVPVPEPASVALIAVGLAALAGVRRRRA
jgi:hypothetical protein